MKWLLKRWMAALQRGEADVFIAWDPPAAMAIAQGWGKTPAAFNSDKLYQESFKVANGLMVRKDFAEKHPDAVQEVVKAYVKATDEMLKDQQGMITRAAELTGVKEPVLLKLTFQNTFPEYVLREQEVLALARAMREAGLTKEDLGSKAVAKFDARYLEKATGKTRDQLQK